MCDVVQLRSQLDEALNVKEELHKRLADVSHEVHLGIARLRTQLHRADEAAMGFRKAQINAADLSSLHAQLAVEQEEASFIQRYRVALVARSLSVNVVPSLGVRKAALAGSSLAGHVALKHLQKQASKRI